MWNCCRHFQKTWDRGKLLPVATSFDWGTVGRLKTGARASPGFGESYNDSLSSKDFIFTRSGGAVLLRESRGGILFNLYSIPVWRTLVFIKRTLYKESLNITSWWILRLGVSTPGLILSSGRIIDFVSWAPWGAKGGIPGHQPPVDSRPKNAESRPSPHATDPHHAGLLNFSSRQERD